MALLVLLLGRMLLGPGAFPSNPVDNFGPSSGGLWDFSSSRSNSHMYHTDTLVCLQGLVQGTSSQRSGFFLLVFPPLALLVKCPSCTLAFVFPTWGVQTWLGVWRVWRPHGHVLGSQLSPEEQADVQS